MWNKLGTYVAVGALAMGAGPAFAIDSFFPTYGNKGIDVLHYDIDLEVNPVSGYIDAETDLLAKAQGKLRQFSLDLHALNVQEVKVNGRPASFSRVADKLVVTPRAPLPSGSKFWVSVSYSGTPEALPDPTAPGQDIYLGWFKYENSTYVVSEPLGASTFFPANDEPTDKATYKFAVTVPQNYTGVANGALIGKKPVGSKTRYEWLMTEPMTSWLATVHVNKLKLDLSRASDGTPVRVYYPDGVSDEQAKGYARAAEMIPFMEKLVGPYPFSSYGTVVVQDPILYYALETQAMSTFPAESPGVIPDEGFVAHELAHQWFGNSISVAKWEDLWIAEGSATYFEILWPNRDDPAAFDSAMLDIYNYVADAQLGPAVVDTPEDLFSDRTYYRGAAALYALRLKVGDRTFFNIMRHFAQDNRGHNVTSEGFIRTAVRFSGDATVRPLLTSWLYDQEVPALPGAASAAAARKGGPVKRPDIVGGRCRDSKRVNGGDCAAPSATQ